MREIEKEKDNIKRKMDMEINSKKIKIFNDKIKKYKLNKKRKKKMLYQICNINNYSNGTNHNLNYIIR